MTQTTLRPLLDSPGRTRTLGAHMQVLDVIETLLRAAKHPDIAGIERYGPGQGPWGPTVNTSKVSKITGVYAKHQSTATASLWEAVWPGEQPLDTIPTMPTPKQNRAPRLLLFVAQLLEVAQPAQFKAWRLVSLPDLGSPKVQDGLPFGLSIVTIEDKRVLLRATATGPTMGFEPETEPFPDYVIPQEVKTCLNGSSTTKTDPSPKPDAVSAGRS